MNKLIFALNATWMSVILLSTFSAQGMEKSVQLDEQLTLAKEFHDPHCPLMTLHNEILFNILSYNLSKQPKPKRLLKNSIKNCMKLSTTCKKFNLLLNPKTIGQFHKSYDIDAKVHLIKDLYYPTYSKCRLPISILVYADAKYERLFVHAMLREDAKLITTLLKNNADPNKDTDGQPAFFSAPTKEIAEMLIHGGANVNAKASCPEKHNVLWAIVLYQMKPELVQLYLDHGTNAYACHPADQSCILHQLGHTSYGITFPDRLLEQATILLKAIPDMINTLDMYENTPLDYAQSSWKDKQNPVFEKLVELFRSHDALTAQELAAQEVAQQAEQLNQ